LEAASARAAAFGKRKARGVGKRRHDLCEIKLVDRQADAA
jgi:hypothetical protein